MRTLPKRLLVASIAMIAVSQQAQAQVTNVSNQESSRVLEEVTVTAQRRSERSLDVPISITALSAEQLGQGDIQQLGDIMKLTPGLRFDNAGAYSQPTIRGVGTAVVVAGTGSNVAVYTDGFYSPNPLMADTDLLNIESVQVLKGPQGTLFGRNATGGAILVSTSDPSSEAAAELEASYGSYNTERYQIYATGGPSEVLAFDIAGLMRSSDGYLDNIVTGSDTDGEYDNWSIRLGARWDLSEKVSALLRYTSSEVDDHSPVAYSAYEENGNVVSTAHTWGITPVATEPYDVSNGFKPGFTSEADAVQLTFKVELDFAMLTSYTQYRDESGEHTYDFDLVGPAFSHYIFETGEEVLTQEFLLASTAESRLQWTVGLFYFNNKSWFENNRASVAGGPFVINGGSGVESETLAVFGDMTYALQDDLYLTVGLRYSEDEVTNAYFVDAATLQNVDVPSIDDSQVTPRIALRYELTDYSSAYASYTEGFKSGILNVGRGTLTGIEVEPEEIKAYEIGYKYGEGPVAFDISAYYYDYQNLQVAGYEGFASLIENAADSTVYGLESQVRYAVSEALEMNFGLSYLHAEYEDFERAQTWEQCLDFVACGQLYGLYQASFVDASGLEMQRSPEFTATLGANYFMELAGGDLNLSGTLYYTSAFFFDTYETYEEDAYQLLSLRAEWVDPSERYTLAVYGDNLTDEEYRNQVLPQFYGALTTWGAPRTVGVSVGVKF